MGESAWEPNHLLTHEMFYCWLLPRVRQKATGNLWIEELHHLISFCTLITLAIAPWEHYRGLEVEQRWSFKRGVDRRHL